MANILKAKKPTIHLIVVAVLVDRLRALGQDRTPPTVADTLPRPRPGPAPPPPRRGAFDALATMGSER